MSWPFREVCSTTVSFVLAAGLTVYQLRTKKNHLAQKPKTTSQSHHGYEENIVANHLKFSIPYLPVSNRHGPPYTSGQLTQSTHSDPSSIPFNLNSACNSMDTSYTIRSPPPTASFAPPPTEADSPAFALASACCSDACPICRPRPPYLEHAPPTSSFPLLRPESLSALEFASVCECGCQSGRGCHVRPKRAPGALTAAAEEAPAAAAAAADADPFHADWACW
jgi:hypothetical protein